MRDGYVLIINRTHYGIRQITAWEYKILCGGLMSNYVANIVYHRQKDLMKRYWGERLDKFYFEEIHYGKVS